MVNSLVCVTTLILNYSGFTLNDNDFSIIKRGHYVCNTFDQYKSTPCLKKFIKKKEREYLVICGELEKNNWHVVYIILK